MRVVRFWTDGGDCWGFPFHHLLATHYSAKDRGLTIIWPLGTIVVVGPKALAFYDDFSNHCATLVKADGKDILSVTMRLKAEADAEHDPRRSFKKSLTQTYLSEVNSDCYLGSPCLHRSRRFGSDSQRSTADELQ